MNRINPVIEEAMSRNNGMITTAEAVALGFSKQLLSRYRQEGLLKRVRQGMYVLPDADYDEMFILQQRSGFIVFSYESALYLNGLKEEKPSVHSITLPSNKAVPNSIKDECVQFYIRPEFHELGLTERETAFHNRVRCYDAERTVCDFVRTRNRCDEKAVAAAIKGYAVSKKKDMERLRSYAGKLKVYRDVRRYMDVLL